MKLTLKLVAAAVVLAPSIGLACPYGSGPAGCNSCGPSLLGYGVSLLLGLGLGFASVGVGRGR
jgi:hypothetical protein